MSHSSSLARTIALTLAVSIFGMTTNGCAARTAHAAAQSSGVDTRALSQDPRTGRITVKNNAPISPEEQIKVGQEAAAQVRQQMPVLPDNSPITQEIRRIGVKIISNAPGYKWPFQFHAVNDKSINAFALPGGEMFVNLGTVQQADEAELAGVMAHELSHVILQHSARDAGKQQGAAVLGAIGAAIAGAVLGNGIGGQLAQMGIQVGAAGVAMKFSRADETEADLLGAQLMYDAGYDPYSLVEFFKVLEQQGGSGMPQLLSDHPNPGNRAATISQAIKKFPKKTYPRSDSPQFASMKKTAMGMKAMTPQELQQYAKQHGGQPQSGAGGQQQPAGPVRASRTQVQPSGRMRSDAFGPISMSYPDNWQVAQQQNGAIIAPQAGVNGNAIAYGVTVGGGTAQSGGSLDDITQQIVQGLVQGNPGTEVTGNPQRIKVNGSDARSVMLRAASPLESGNGQQVAETDWVVTVAGPQNQVLYLVFTAPQQDFSWLRPTFDNMLRSVQWQQ